MWLLLKCVNRKCTICTPYQSRTPSVPDVWSIQFPRKTKHCMQTICRIVANLCSWHRPIDTRAGFSLRISSDSDNSRPTRKTHLYNTKHTCMNDMKNNVLCVELCVSLVGHHSHQHAEQAHTHTHTRRRASDQAEYPWRRFRYFSVSDRTTAPKVRRANIDKTRKAPAEQRHHRCVNRWDGCNRL